MPGITTNLKHFNSFLIFCSSTTIIQIHTSFLPIFNAGRHQMNLEYYLPYVSSNNLPAILRYLHNRNEDITYYLHLKNILLIFELYNKLP